MDAAALLTNSANADGEIVWSRRLGAGVKFSGGTLLGNDGDKKPIAGKSAL